MEVSMTQAAISAALSVVLGAVLGVIYDIIRFLRAILSFDVKNPFKKGKITPRKILGYIFVCVTDFLFFVIAAVLFCVFFYLSGDGRMRGYALGCALVGFIVYYNTVGRLFIGALTCIISLIKRGMRLLLIPLGGISAFVKKICMRIFDMPIVKAQFTRYNVYINKRKIKAKSKLLRKKAKKGGYCSNGGTHG